MNRLVMHTLTLGLAVGVFVAGCGGGGSQISVPDPGPGPLPAGKLRPVSNPAELEASIKAGLTRIQSTQTTDTTAVASPGAPAMSQFSRTYTQEQNVDEFDSVKYDGNYMFVAPMRQQFPCCFLAAQTFAPTTPPPPVERSIRILQTDPATAAATEVSHIPLADDISVQGLYRTGDRLIAMTSKSFYGSFGDAWASFAIWAPEQSGLSVYDTSDIANPALIFDAAFDGAFIESRRVGDTVYVVTRYTPNIDNLVYYVTTAEQQASNQSVLNGVTLAELLPRVTVNGSPSSLVTPTNCFVPNDEPPGYAVITSITAIPVSNPAAFTTTCYNDDSYGIYVSETAIYIAQSKSQGQGTRLHKFSLNGGAPNYAGSADIDGIVWTGGQADFRLSEKDGYLRVFASKYDAVVADNIDHFLYVLRQATGTPELEVVAQLPNSTRPEEIGKPNEQLYGVRFVDDRAYAVTFERVDPLYVFDLTSPTDPRVAGTLEITGFSDLLHPVSAELLLGLGTSENNAVKLELFDVSNIAQPLSVDSEILGGRGSYSEATYDRHAFTYLADVNGVDRFTIPADLTADDDSYQIESSGLFLYEIRDKSMPNLASLHRVGSVIVHAEDDTAQMFFSARSRAVLHDDALYYIRDDEVFSTMWNASEIVNGPF